MTNSPISPDNKPEALDDVMLAMDVVDTLRHRERILNKELSTEEREAALIKRLKEIYSAQGIKVSDEILKDGVKALEEQRFTYTPPKNNFNIKLAHIYINRGKWFKPVGLIFGVAAFTTGVYEFGIDGPRDRIKKNQQIELSQTVPNKLAQTRNAAIAIATTDNARNRLEAAFQKGNIAAQNGDLLKAREATRNLELLYQDLRKELIIRVVSRPGEYSGVFRIPDTAHDGRNYYLIVEAVDASGTVASLEISSEEDRTVARVDRWGVRVPEGEFNRIAADKQDDQIIQNATIGNKPRGALQPNYTIDTTGGAILKW